MGKVVTLKYRLETFERTPNGYISKHIYGYRTKAHGTPNKVNLERYVRGVNESVLPGGINEHVSKALGYVPYIYKARIVNQFTGEIHAGWIAPSFEVL